MNEWFIQIWENYDILASLSALAGSVAIVKLGKFLAFKIQPLEEMRKLNRAEDKTKWALDKYPPIVRGTQKMGMYCNIFLFLVVLPFCVSFEAQPWWRLPLDFVVILMFYDFFYYLSHRFWFHGNGPMRKIHAVHHQARNPTYLDSHYVHPTETLVGLFLIIGSIAFLAVFMGPFHVATMAVLYAVYTQLNTINHTHVDLPYFPFKALTWITAKHHVHHENMHKGNYATITLFYDKLFGTLD